MVRLILTAAMIAALAGCSSTPEHKQPFTPHVSRSGLDPLIDAPTRMKCECRGSGLLVAGQPLGGFSFECPDLDVRATLNELRDAGWRVEKMTIGRHVQALKDDDPSGTPLTVVIRKVY